MSRNAIRFLRNGVPTTLEDVDPNETLLNYLRLRERSTGTKEGCNEGDCGACTVALGSIKNGELVYEPINACIQLLGQIDGKDLITIDDLAQGEMLHPVQQAMVDTHGSQCGFCTSGIIMSLFTLYHSGNEASRQNVNDWLSGNLCRCTGYRPIAQAADNAISGKANDFLTQRFEESLDLLNNMGTDQDVFIGDGTRFFAAPASTEKLAELCMSHPDAVILSGATDVGLWITKQLRDLPKIIYTGRAQEFGEITTTDDEIRIGAGASYADAQYVLEQLDPDIGEIVRRIGSKPVRASGTIGGNIANGSPIGDMPPVLIAMNARLEMRYGNELRTVSLENFFIDYGKQDLRPGELVNALIIPRLGHNQQLRAYKISKRFDQDISCVLAAFNFEINDNTITSARIAFGGMAATPKRSRSAEIAISGTSLNDDTAIEQACLKLANDFSPLTDMRASAEYRMKISQNLMRKAINEIRLKDTGATRLIGIRETAQ